MLRRLAIAGVRSLSLAVLMAVPTAVTAQVGTADLVIIAVADEAVPLDGVAVTVRSTATGLERTAVTDARGATTLSTLAPGLWVVSAAVWELSMRPRPSRTAPLAVMKHTVQVRPPQRAWRAGSAVSADPNGVDTAREW